MYTYIHIHIYLCMYVHIYTYICIYTYMYLYICVCVSLWVRVCGCEFVFGDPRATVGVFEGSQSVLFNIYTCICVYVCGYEGLRS